MYVPESGGPLAKCTWYKSIRPPFAGAGSNVLGYRFLLFNRVCDDMAQEFLPNQNGADFRDRKAIVRVAYCRGAPSVADADRTKHESQIVTIREAKAKSMDGSIDEGTAAYATDAKSEMAHPFLPLIFFLSCSRLLKSGTQALPRMSNGSSFVCSYRHAHTRPTIQRPGHCRQ